MRSISFQALFPLVLAAVVHASPLTSIINSIFTTSSDASSDFATGTSLSGDGGFTDTVTDSSVLPTSTPTTGLPGVGGFVTCQCQIPSSALATATATISTSDFPSPTDSFTSVDATDSITDSVPSEIITDSQAIPTDTPTDTSSLSIDESFTDAVPPDTVITDSATATLSIDGTFTNDSLSATVTSVVDAPTGFSTPGSITDDLPTSTTDSFPGSTDIGTTITASPTLTDTAPTESSSQFTVTFHEAICVCGGSSGDDDTSTLTDDLPTPTDTSITDIPSETLTDDLPTSTDGGDDSGTALPVETSTSTEDCTDAAYPTDD